MEHIRLGTIGSGMIVNFILECVQKTEGIDLTCVYSRSREKGEDLARRFGGARVYTDMTEFLQDGDMNCVYIASPNSLHYPQAKAALLAGKHVLLEKPFCTRLCHAEELFALAEEKGLLLTEAVPTAFLPNLAVLRRELPKIGRIRLVMTNYSQYSSRYDALRRGELPNIFNPELGGGSIMDINFYNAWLNAALFGPPESVSYTANLHTAGADTSGALVLKYRDFVSQNAGAKDTWGENFIQIEGEEGYLYVTGGNGFQEVRLVTKEGCAVFNEQPHPHRWLYEIQTLTEVFLREDRKALEELKQATLHTAKILEEARHSAGIRFPEDSQ